MRLKRGLEGKLLKNNQPWHGWPLNGHLILQVADQTQPKVASKTAHKIPSPVRQPVLKFTQHFYITSHNPETESERLQCLITNSKANDFYGIRSIIQHRETHESELMRHSSKALSHTHKCRANMSKIPEVHMWDEYFLQEFPAGMTKPEKPHPQALSAADRTPVPHNLPLLKLVMLTMSITHATIDHKRR